MKKHRYTVRVSSHTTIVVMATSATSAKSEVWKDIKGAYTYGFKTRKEFMKGTSAHRG